MILIIIDPFFPIVDCGPIRAVRPNKGLHHVIVYHLLIDCLVNLCSGPTGIVGPRDGFRLGIFIIF